MDYAELALHDELIAISHRAGERILEVYHRAGEMSVDHKDDASPLTEADLAAHREIVDGLQQLTPEIPVLSEESEELAWETRRNWDRYWLVDPLDGTKEFINRNGEFTVNIALIESGAPVLGVVYVPVTGKTYSGAAGVGAWMSQDGARSDIRVRALPAHVDAGGKVTVVASRRHRGADLDACVKKITDRFGEVAFSSMGSSLKICLLAEGEADLYPRLAPTSEWDTAAAQAVLEAAGGTVVDTKFQTLRYNQKENILNPFFIAIADPAFDWRSVIG